MNATSSQAHVWQLDDLNRAIRAAGVALWLWDIDNDSFKLDDQAFSLWVCLGLSASRSRCYRLVFI